MRNKMHVIIPAVILFVLAIPAAMILFNKLNETAKKSGETEKVIEQVIIGISKTQDGEFILPAEADLPKDAWDTPLKAELSTEKAGGIYIFSKRPEAQKVTIISAGPDCQFGTRDDIKKSITAAMK